MMNKFSRIVIFFLFVSILWFHPVFGKSSKYKYNLVICAIFRDEAPYLKEWIEFHLLMGVEHFYLYNNRSSDEFRSILAPYIQKKIVTIIEWPYRYEKPGRWSPIQCSAYQDALDSIRKKAKWAAIVDIDEFIFPVEKNNLVEFLKDYEEFGGVCANWQMYGTSFIPKIPDDKLLIETLHLKAPVEFSENRLVKSIVQPKHVESCKNPHFCFFHPGFHQVDENKVKFEGPRTQTVSINKLRVNHYWSRDEDFFYRVKMPRREAWYENAQGQLNRLNAINTDPDDNAIQRFVPLLKHQLLKQ